MTDDRKKESGEVTVKEAVAVINMAAEALGHKPYTPAPERVSPDRLNQLLMIFSEADILSVISTEAYSEIFECLKHYQQLRAALETNQDKLPTFEDVRGILCDTPPEKDTP